MKKKGNIFQLFMLANKVNHPLAQATTASTITTHLAFKVYTKQYNSGAPIPQTEVLNNLFFSLFPLI